MKKIETLFAASILVVGLTACGNSNDNGESDLDAQFRANFTESCNKSAIATGTPENVASDVCDCAADDVIANYSMVERVQLRGKKADAILDQCLVKTGHDSKAEG